MTSEQALTVISVRADAQRTVAPDSASLHVEVVSVAPERAAAMTTLRDEMDALTAGLRELGGRQAAVEDERAPLTWTVRTLRAHDYREDKEGPLHHRASADIRIDVRDFDLSAELERLVGARPALSLEGMQWRVDHDNAAWPAVRAEAIAAALRKGTDYAAALGGTVTGIEQVADVGLLEGSDRAGFVRQSARPLAARAGGGGADYGAAPLVHPVPQTIVATIDARLIATIAWPPEVI